MIISDLHVHFHKRYNRELFFNSIKNNFQKFCTNYESKNTNRIICLTESNGVSFFNELYLKSSLVNNWSFNRTNNNNVILAEHKTGFELFIIGSRQIVTKENLEVLAVGMVNDFKDGQPIEAVIKEVIAGGFIPIIPWGFGKWTGNRGEIVEDIIEQNKYYPLFLGDNGNRPKFIKLPPIFKSAKENHIQNLQGSDPLPFGNEETRPGSFGILIEDSLNPDNPFESFLNIIISENVKIKTYGELESYYKFFKHQIGMQIVKRLRK
jgi:hypothetical protein